ncbi:MAG: Na+:solute symporter [Candidatus Hydrogenedentes bacterium]|nr:Na+:solute symporter [Candidatus Hydrogenedentota bacterium]
MYMSWFDWSIVAAFFALSLAIGLSVTRKAGQNSTEYFGAGKTMPWWLLGISMVATTFSADTPNLVTDIVRTHGVGGNWLWWSYLLTGMLTVFVYARLWQRAGVLTDVEFYELRYSGRSAAFLRGFRAVYLGFFFNVLIMASVSLAAIKIGRILLGLSPWQTLLIAGAVTAFYSSLGGLRSVLLTDAFQFVFAMAGSFGAAYYALQHEAIGGLSGLLAHEVVQTKLDLIPTDRATLITAFMIPLAVQWWSTWYPGSEPGGGGFIAQRMLAAKDERNAIGAAFFFNAAHYALRPWPWIIVALCSLVVYPDIDAIKQAFPAAADIVKEDAAYSAMLTFLPAGLIGVVVTSLIAAYMSTISTLLNWGSSYIIHDFYQRFVKPDCTEKQAVSAGRITTVLLMVFAGVLALFLENALDSFQIMLQIGAGTGLLFILRWFWWRINAMSEIAAMFISFAVAIYFRLVHEGLGFPVFDDSTILVISVAITTAGWLLVTLITRPTDHEKLATFYRRVHPGGPGWRAVLQRAEAQGSPIVVEQNWYVPLAMLCMLLGCVAIYSTLFATGYWIYGRTLPAMFLSVIAVGSTVILVRSWSRLVQFD